MMHGLDIRFIKKGEIIAKELDECLEVLFVMEGRYNIGYEINKKVHFRKQFGSSTMIGSFQISFQKRFLFMYKAQNNMHCYSINKMKWIRIA
jgi:hypothetical protein